MQAPSATSIDEAPLCRWLFGASAARYLLASELHLAPNSYAMFEIPTGEVCPGADRPGDIDVLVSSAGAPELSIAVEVKRIKIAPHTFSTGQPGKLSALKRGVHQANALHKLGFHRSYLMVAIVVDAREQTGERFVLSGPPPELLRVIDQFPGREQLNPNVGVGFFEISQPIDREVRFSGQIGLRIVQEPTGIDQSAAVTDGVRRLLRERVGPLRQTGA